MRGGRYLVLRYSVNADVADIAMLDDSVGCDGVCVADWDSYG